MKVQALFKLPKVGAKVAKKSAPAKKLPSSSSGSKGWFGGEGGSQTSLDKWYGE
jgi:hypothetical protein